jgi:uncharacterized protein (TIGR03435 family)
MMQSLLADRFKLSAHHEEREVPVYAAVLEQPRKLGPQLRKHSTEDACPQPGAVQQPTSDAGQSPGPEVDSAGFPVVCNGFANHMRPSASYHRRFGGGNVSVATIVSSFSALAQFGRPVVDWTGLNGGYDFFLDYLPDPPPGKELPPDALGPAFVDAVKSQLGIKLVREKASIDFVIVDHVERPSAN